ncbi:murein biosynthesis integral membrane protein MurJ [Patescibacteria group bacterium]|nr:murein biosynthesis integral membrane protein MurJ [Patescibacteria group bacterium]MBU4161983.1 murein biosynthesis integral membrane protein MurJ [Patescibacteria group bacterium]
MIKRILNLKSSNITIAALILSAASLTSALLGFFRDRLLAGRFGAGDELDIYYTAFRIPDFVNMVLIMGAISAAIVPIFTLYWSKDKEEARKFLANLLNIMFTAFAAVSLVLLIFAPQLVSVIAPGFSGAKKEMTVLLTRIMFLSPIILGTSNVLSGILHVFSRFLVTALAPIMYNLGIIFGILFFVPKIGLVGLAWGVALGAFLHLMIQLPIFLHLGFRPMKIFAPMNEGIKKVFYLMLPRSIGIGVSQINFMVMTAIGSTLAAGSIAVFNLANNLSRSFIILLAVPFSTAAFPALATVFSEGRKDEFLKKFSLSFRLLLFLIIPASAFLFILRAQVVRIIFGTGRFSWADTRLTGACLALFSISLFAYGLGLLLSRAFYAAHNTKTPTLISVSTVLVNIVLCFSFVYALQNQGCFHNFISSALKLKGLGDISIVGLPLAYSISGIIQFVLLFTFLHKKIGSVRKKEIIQTAKKTIIATIPAVVATYFSLRFFALFLNTATFGGIFAQTAGAGITGLLTYLLISVLIKSEETKLLKNFLKRYITKYKFQEIIEEN